MKNKILLFLFCLSFLGTANAQSPSESELSTATAPYFLKIHCQDEKKFEWIWFRPHLGHAGYWDANEGKDKPFTRWLPTGNPNHIALDFGVYLRLDFKIQSSEKVTLSVTEREGSYKSQSTCQIERNESPWEYFMKMEGVQINIHSDFVNGAGYDLLTSLFNKNPDWVYDLEMMLKITGKNLRVLVTNHSQVSRSSSHSSGLLKLDAFRDPDKNEEGEHYLPTDRPLFLESMISRMIRSLVALAGVDNVEQLVFIDCETLQEIENFNEFIEMIPAIVSASNKLGKSLMLVNSDVIKSDVIYVNMRNPASLKNFSREVLGDFKKE